jgi:hypothetical protein
MSYLVTCTFDLKNASRTDYENAYTDLKRIGLNRVIVSANGSQVVAPTTMTAGEFNGQSATAVRDYVRDKVRAVFSARRLSSEIFVVVGGDWAWGAATSTH